MSTGLLDVLDPSTRSLLATRLATRRFRRGDVVFHEGDRGDCLYLVARGRFAVHVSSHNGIEMIVRVVQPNEFFGELALVQPDYRRNARLTALEPAETLVLHRDDFEDVRRHRPDVDRLLVTVLAQRVRAMTIERADSLLAPERRVLRHLAVLADAYGDEPIQLTQDDLAAIAGTVRQTANRALCRAQQAGAIERHRGAIRVIDRAALRQLDR